MNVALAKPKVGYVDGRMLIGGELVASESGQWMESVNPATEEVIGRAPRGNAKDIDKAVQAAEKAQPEWANLPVSKRADYLGKLCAAIAKRFDDIAPVESMDTGNSMHHLRNGMPAALDKIKFHMGLGYELKGYTVPSSTPNNLHFTVREPYGVVGRIIPFNHPFNFTVGGLGAPLMAGNTIVEKPADQSPLSGTMLAEIIREVMPPGVVNLVTGTGPEAGDALVRHPKVKRIAFTGSAKTGMAIQRAAAEVAVKHISMELGGKNPLIVFPDADYERAVAGAIAGMNFTHQSQSCGSTSRLFVHESLYDRFVADVAKKMAAFRVGDPLDEATQMGPINSKGQYEKVLYYIKAGQEDGARLVTGGKRPEGPIFQRGYWIQPTLFADVKPDMRIAREEIFGPVLSAFKWKDVEEVVALANDVEYGLTGSVWTKDLNTALTMARRIKSGYIWINGGGPHHKGMPFGGQKNSGVGREGTLDELLSYTEEKAIHVLM